MGLYKSFATVLLVLFFFISCSKEGHEGYSHEREFNDTTLACISEEIIPNLNIREGLISQKSDTIRVLRDGKTIAIVMLSEPILVAQSEKEEVWGYFQFPGICEGEDGNLIVQWSMRADSPTAYGDKTAGRCVSNDNGNTWIMTTEELFFKEGYSVELRNGHLLQLNNPASKDITTYNSFPNPVNEKPIVGTNFYLESELPEDLKGVYFNKWNEKRDKSELIHSSIEDEGLLRSASNNLMPIVWWGKMKELKDESIVAGVYGGFYQNANRDVLRSSISFYKSIDEGKHWKVIGKIPYQMGGANCESFVFDGNDGFTEPAFEILGDSSFICVMRTSSTTPMCKSFSSDRGKSWSVPEPFTPNGVKPSLLLLKNGILVLVSGRPGVQLRFSINGDGKVWTEPIEMLPFMDEKGIYDLWGVTCGYSCIIPIDDQTFYMVYSDFKSKNDNNEYRKSIVFRKVEIFTH